MRREKAVRLHLDKPPKWLSRAAEAMMKVAQRGWRVWSKLEDKAENKSASVAKNSE